MMLQPAPIPVPPGRKVKVQLNVVQRQKNKVAAKNESSVNTHQAAFSLTHQAAFSLPKGPPSRCAEDSVPALGGGDSTGGGHPLLLLLPLGCLDGRLCLAMAAAVIFERHLVARRSGRRRGEAAEAGGAAEKRGDDTWGSGNETRTGVGNGNGNGARRAAGKSDGR